MGLDREFVKKPWGHFDRLILNEVSTVKLLHMEPNAQLSLQYHHNRNEFWRILSGTCKVMLDDKVFEAKAGDEFEIATGVKHRMVTEGDAVDWLEISFGVFDETDIVRLEDSYGREGTTEVH